MLKVRVRLFSEIGVWLKPYPARSKYTPNMVLFVKIPSILLKK